MKTPGLCHLLYQPHRGMQRTIPFSIVRPIVSIIAILLIMGVSFPAAQGAAAPGMATRQMPAELKITVANQDYTPFGSWTGEGTVPFQIPQDTSRGRTEPGAEFAGQAKLTFHFTTGSKLKCTAPDYSQDVTMTGRSEERPDGKQKLYFTFDANPRPTITMKCQVRINKTTQERVIDTWQLHGFKGGPPGLDYEDGAYVTTPSVVPERLTLKLHLACHIAKAPGTINVMMLPKVASWRNWPSSMPDLSMTIAQLNKAYPPPAVGGLIGLALGQTVLVNPPPDNLKPVEIKAAVKLSTTASQIGGGVCYWVDNITVTFPNVQIFMPSQFPKQGTTACNYQALYSHENQHYTAFSMSLMKHQEGVKQNLSAALPTGAQPRYAPTKIDAANDLSATITDITDAAMTGLHSDDDQSRSTIETEEERERVLKQCARWPGLQ